MQERDYRLLKDLAFEFVCSRDPEIFKAIVMQVDRFLVFTIRKARQTKPYLKKVSLQDLYHDAIVGLHTAILKTTVDTPGSKIFYWIRCYVNNELVKHNRRTNRVSFPFSVDDIAFQVHLYFRDMSQIDTYINQINNKLVENVTPFRNLELESIRESFPKLIKEGVISFEEFEMLVMYFVTDMTYRDIAKSFGISPPTVSRKIKNALNRLRYEFRRRGWGDGLT